VEGFVGSYYFMQFAVLMSILFVFSFGVNERECIMVMWYLKAEILCSMVWFEKKLMVLSVVVGFWNMSISRLDGFRIISRTRKLIHPLFSCVTLSFIFVGIWFMCVFSH